VCVWVDFHQTFASSAAELIRFHGGKGEGHCVTKYDKKCYFCVCFHDLLYALVDLLQAGESTQSSMSWC